MRVLLVEDDPDQLDIRAQLLEARGHVVERTETAADALRAAGVFHPQGIVADLHLAPVANSAQDGVEMIRALRELCPQAKILVISGDESSPDVQAAVRYDAGYIQKGSSGASTMLKMMDPSEM